MSRAHYALVRKVETAMSPQAADTTLLAEIEAIHYRLLHSTLTQKQLKECLILLLYCSMATTAGIVPDLTFALPHAISLAEAGKTVHDKRIGYEFCADIMPKHHELKLMLVNTLRKDIHSHEVPRICLALDILIQIPPEDVIPAVQDRLFELLSHTSPLVRRRALFAYRSLSEHSQDILNQIVDKVQKRLDDPDYAVVGAALAVSVELHTHSRLPITTFHASLTRLLRNVWQNVSRHRSGSWLLLKVLQALQNLRALNLEDFEVISGIVRTRMSVTPLSNAIKYQCFSVVAAHPDLLASLKSPPGNLFISAIRHLLTSDNINDIYTFISSLESLEPRYWAGISADIPSVLEAWEVERVMSLLGSNDQAIRKKVLRILLKVDRTIVESYFNQLSASNFASVLQDKSGELKRPLEVIEVLCGEDGESYAQQVVLTFTAIDENPHRKGHVYEGAVEDILNYIRGSSIEFRSGCLGVFFGLLAGRGRAFDSTLATILSALVCEYLDSCPVSPEDLLRGLSSLLPNLGAAIQDACLLAMIRVSANCSAVPEDVLGTVRKVQEAAGRHIKRRCNQFLELSQTAQMLKDIVSRSKSTSLPDFVIALETYEAERQTNVPRPSSSNAVGSPERPSSRTSTTASKLRYTAYDAPKPTPRLRRISSTSSSLSASRSDVGRESEDLARTVSPGELALASGRSEFQEIARSPVSSPPTLPSVQVLEEDELASQADLISLDSPFVSEPITSICSFLEPDFETVWNSLASSNTRGWYDSPMDVLVRKLQSLQKPLRVTPADQPPFIGDLKIQISTSPGFIAQSGVALLRLKEGEEESCLWHLRCADESLRNSIKALLKDG
ncbi:unnamed protein product [Somion occarium]|uniref:Clathrin/coatomer adaptor adaptin-like N-terminal domain-containing protein n=1 Tax=Somion occarium TaxID=3059160 RepID=A0ABP1DB89_9APHY